jgi:L-rhamnose mutarotase
MKRVAFKMYLKPGCEAEYEKRHNEIWPELVALLKETGSSDYSIFWDKETNILFAVQKSDGKVAAKFHDGKRDQIYNHLLNPDNWYIKYFD